jgi:hypothetical protein
MITQKQQGVKRLSRALENSPEHKCELLFLHFAIPGDDYVLDHHPMFQQDDSQATQMLYDRLRHSLFQAMQTMLDFDLSVVSDLCKAPSHA